MTTLDRRVRQSAPASARRMSCLALAICWSALRLSAQQPNAPPLTDSARADSVRRARHALVPVVVTGTRLSDVDERTPAQVEQLDIRRPIPGPDALTQAMQHLPGVSLFDDQGSHLQPELSVRGFTVSPIVGTPQGVSVFLDGIRVNEPDAQEVNFDLLPMAAVDQATLVRGSESLFGRNSLGGTLLLTTRRGGPNPEASVDVGAGSFGEQHLTLSAGGALGGFDGFVAATGSNETGWRQATANNTRQLFGVVGHQWGPSPDSGDLALEVLYAHDRLHEAGSLPESYIAVDRRINYTPGDFFAPELLHVALRGTGPVGGGLVRGTVFARRNYYEQFNVNVPPPSSDNFIHNLSGGGALEWTRPVHVGAVPLGLTVGGEYGHQDIHFRLLSVRIAGGDSLATLATAAEDDAALFAQTIVNVTPSLSFTAGIRDDYVRVPYRDTQVPANNGTSVYHEATPELGVNYRVSEDVRGYVAYKTGFRAPAPLELACASPTAPCSLPSALSADPVLRPVTTRDFEGGIDIDFARRTSLDVDAFWTNVIDDIQFTAPDLTHVFFINVPKTRRAGIEGSGQIGLPSGFRLTGSYSYVAATYQSVVQIASADTNPRPARPGSVFPSSPLHRGQLGVATTQLIGPVIMEGEATLRACSSQYLRGDEANQRRPVAGYSVAGLRGRVVYGRYQLRVDIDNLFDRRYATFGIEAPNTLGPPGSHQFVPRVPVVRFLTPGFPRRITISLAARF